MSLLDSAQGDGDDDAFLAALGRCKANGACQVFGIARPSDKPSALASLPEAPKDDRAIEVASAAAAGLFATGAILAHPPAAFVLPGLASAWGLDRYQQGGEAIERIGRGLGRLDQGPMARDLQRDCALDSAAFMVGYLLGVPCCISAATLDGALDVLRTPTSELGRAAQASSALARTSSSALTVLASARVVDRLLLWLLAPAALEVAQFGEVRVADPSVALEFVKAARRREAFHGVDVSQGGEWLPEEDEQRVAWAYAEAGALLRRCSALQQALQERMVEGVSVGECVVLVEEQLGNQVQMGGW